MSSTDGDGSGSELAQVGSYDEFSTGLRRAHGHFSVDDVTFAGFSAATHESGVDGFLNETFNDGTRRRIATVTPIKPKTWSQVAPEYAPGDSFLLSGRDPDDPDNTAAREAPYVAAVSTVSTPVLLSVSTQTEAEEVTPPPAWQLLAGESLMSGRSSANGNRIRDDDSDSDCLCDSCTGSQTSTASGFLVGLKYGAGVITGGVLVLTGVYLMLLSLDYLKQMSESEFSSPRHGLRPS